MSWLWLKAVVGRFPSRESSAHGNSGRKNAQLMLECISRAVSR